MDVLNQLFQTPSPITGLSMGHLTVIGLFILALIGITILYRIFGHAAGCILRLGCILVLFFACGLIATWGLLGRR
ncbi:MAG: hypothetical protein KF726_21120 [Anaerolineae bacterium]|nr:hypothetical protein [Anaerolineae bacterium]